MSAVRLRAWVWLAIAVLLGAACVLQFTHSARLQTNLLTLLPATERNPVAEDAVSRLADTVGNRAVFLVGGVPLETAARAAREFARALQDAGAFRQVTSDIPPTDLGRLTAIYREHRHSLLSAADREALRAGHPALAERLQAKLNAPLRLGLSLPLADDPFGFADVWLAALPLADLRIQPADGLLVVRDHGAAWVLVTAELKGSAYDDRIQRPVLRATTDAEHALARAFPEVRLLRAGTVFYAQAARSSAETEFHLIGAGSLVGMLVLLYLVFRSPRPLALGLLSVAFGICAGLVATIQVYGEIHLITLVFGASLIGEAIDYSVQYFAAHLGAGPAWEPIGALRRITPGLAMALATSLLGYGALWFAPFPALSQIALFALAGLSAAWLSVFLLLPALLRRPTTRDPAAAFQLPRRLLAWWQAHMDLRRCLLLMGGLLIAAVPGWWQLRGDDDIRLLIDRPAALLAQEQQLRELAGLGQTGQFILVEGATPDEVLAREEALSTRLAPLVASGALGGWQALSSFVPSAQRQSDNHALLATHVYADESALRTLLDDAGVRDDVAARQKPQFLAAGGRTLSLQDWLQAPVSAPFRHLWLGATPHGYASIVLPQGLQRPADVRRAVDALPGVAFVDKAGSISALFHQYRLGSVQWLVCALALVYGVLCLRYGARKATGVLAPTVLAMGLALACFGYAHVPLTLFHLMGLMLVLGVGVNYPIFLLEGGGNEAATLSGVLLSAGTTLLSFGLLAFSSMPALSGFGATLLVGIGMSVLLSPVVLSLDARRPR